LCSNTTNICGSYNENDTDAIQACVQYCEYSLDPTQLEAITTSTTTTTTITTTTSAIVTVTAATTIATPITTTKTRRDYTKCAKFCESLKSTNLNASEVLEATMAACFNNMYLCRNYWMKDTVGEHTF
jgi:hypothetical protein